LIRNVDKSGRIAVPKKILKALNINNGDGIEIYVDGECINLQKHIADCYVCGSSHDTQNANKGYLCHRCFEKLKLK